MRQLFPRFKKETSTQSISLEQVIKTCLNNAFQQNITIDYNCSSKNNKSNSHTYTLNNYEDPLFIHLRFKGLEKKNNKKNKKTKLKNLNR